MWCESGGTPYVTATSIEVFFSLFQPLQFSEDFVNYLFNHLFMKKDCSNQVHKATKIFID